jgi:hypothetical protein
LLERGHVGDAVRQSGAAVVEANEPGERRGTTEHVGVVRLFPLTLDVGDEAWDDDEVERAVAHNLICNVNVTALGVPSLWLV